MIVAITAGGRVSGALAAAIGTPVKALAPFAGSTLLDVAIAAARASGARRIAVIGGDSVRAACGARVDEVIAESADGRENIRKAIETGAREALLLMTSDMPFVDAASVADFLARLGKADVALPLASASAYERAYPGAPPHVTRIGRDRIANGSIVYFGPGIAPRVLDAARDLFEARKSLVRMAMLLGPALLARFAIGRLGIADVERRARTLLGIDARAVRDAAPSLCYDVDAIEDYAYALAHRPG
ncbi:MAG: NTP transferase domain-containing protein [Candidatus Eremiobacteraeota bacterium]|nr:NTP transferase domain-containing protein [Candidatus Eremiobacteraeota bacterium]